MSAAGVSAGTAAGGGSVNPPPCACRLCKEKLNGNLDSGSEGVNRENSIGAGLEHPRNPMNKRTYLDSG